MIAISKKCYSEHDLWCNRPVRPGAPDKARAGGNHGIGGDDAGAQAATRASRSPRVTSEPDGFRQDRPEGRAKQERQDPAERRDQGASHRAAMRSARRHAAQGGAEGKPLNMIITKSV